MPSSFCLNTPRLWIRPLQGNDHPDLAEMMQNPVVMAAWEHVFSEKEIDQWILRNLQRYLADGAGYWAVIHKDKMCIRDSPPTSRRQKPIRFWQVDFVRWNRRRDRWFHRLALLFLY